ncbi:MAG: GPR endopeptidase [Lachnospiraceae bacterium]|jgi:spore protease|nr:GPR endopeptidase [Lachnospiraceae bacterium]MCI8957763.1 GPR endopeptidase [Lachnospiraceae bacterium]
MKNTTFEIRTDLALEEKESYPGDGGEIRGVSLREWEDSQCQVRFTEVKILDSQGAEAMGKPQGTYLTLEADRLSQEDEDYHGDIARELGIQIRSLMARMVDKEDVSILAVGLGNHMVTPDALGPKVVEHLQMTRHLEQQYGEGFCRKRKLPVLSGIVPGVMAQTGMETAEILKGVIRQTRPDVVVAVDALAARSIRRLGTTIQLTDTGIHPGSGVGNHRNSLTKESLGVPVLAIGVPTVVGTAAIVYDTVDTMIQTLNRHVSTRGMGNMMESMTAEEQYALICELLEPEFGSLYVTPPDIDERIGRLSFTVSEGIHEALYQ